ncbi:DUF3810 family protein, partial [Clostridioides difficile]|uniref:DUF3810 family protein n=1 Tax=Clostridioides difficile TaxID=1496 RepID=UPI0031B5F13F
VDYNAYVDISAGISDSVRRDLKNESEFWQKYEGKINEISNEFNNSYLKQKQYNLKLKYIQNS